MKESHEKAEGFQSPAHSLDLVTRRGGLCYTLLTKNWELAGIQDLRLDGDPMAATPVAKGSRDTGPSFGGEAGNWESLKCQSVGSTQTPVGTSAVPRALAKETLPASPPPSQLAMRAEFTVSAILHVFPRQAGRAHGRASMSS